MDKLLKCPNCSVLIGMPADGRCPACGQATIASLTPTLRVVRNPEQFSQTEPASKSHSVQFAIALRDSTPRVWVTPALIVVNVVIFVAMLASSRSFSPSTATVLDWGANYGPKTLNGEWWRLFTAMFLHFNVVHLGLNMWALANLGRLTERMVGNVGFLVLYLVSGLLGSLTSVAWNSEAVSAGASGAVFGIGGALLGFLLSRRNSIPPAVLVPLRNSMFSFVGYNVVFGFLVPGIDNAAHLGGLAAGIGCGLLQSHPLTPEGVRRRWLRNAILLIVGIGIAICGFRLLPEAPADWQAEVQHLFETEERARAQANDLAQRFRARKLGDAEFADELERRPLADLIAAKKHFDSLRIPSSHRIIAGKLGEFLQLRIDSWKSLVTGLRGNDQAAINRSLEQSAAADRFLQHNAKEPAL